MNHTKANKILFGVLITGATITIGWLVWLMFLSEDMREYRLSQQNPITHEYPTVQMSHAHAVTDLSDDRKLAGFTQDIFIGRVLEKLGQTEERGWPETQFKVRVLDALKGEVQGDITVNQQGGIREADNSIYRREGDPNLLEAGKTYLFATRYYDAEDWHTVMPGYGNLAIKDSKDLSDVEVLSSSHTVQLKVRFSDAIANEIPYNPGVR